MTRPRIVKFFHDLFTSPQALVEDAKAQAVNGEDVRKVKRSMLAQLLRYHRASARLDREFASRPITDDPFHQLMEDMESPPESEHSPERGKE